MNWQNIAFDWNQIRAFLVTAEEGSLSAAARGLGLTQPTLSRQVAALEETLGVTLFERAGRALVLTETGLTLLEHVRMMGDAAGAVALAASGRAEAIEGRVCITATDMASAYLLPPVLRVLAEAAPGIAVDVIADNNVRNLQRREADIALRNAAPTEPDLITRRLRDTRAVFCASPAYLERHGPITTQADLETATWVGYDNAEQMVTGLAQAGLTVRAEQFRYCSPTGVVVYEMVRAGLGVGVLSEDMRGVLPDVVTLLPDRAPLPIPLYLIAHRELRTSRRIRVVWDALADALG